MCKCEVCLRIATIKASQNHCFVMELETGYVVFGDHQRFEGYTLFLCKEHVREVYDLESEVRMQHLMEMSVVAEAVAAVFLPDKMNIESLGNGIAHLHWHLYPRRQNDMPFVGPVWRLGDELYHDKWKITAEFIDTYCQPLITTINLLLQNNEYVKAEN